MQLTTVGLDLAKNLFQVHGVDERGKAVLRKQLRRDQVAAFFANLPPCLVGMEACASAHPWARKLQSFGHTVRLIAPQFVKPYVKSNKNDAADAEAICEAVGRPSMRFVPVKNTEQQSVLALHRVRQSFVKARTAQANQIRGLLGEYGLVVPQGIGYIAKRVPELIEDATVELPGAFRVLIDRLLEHLKLLQLRVDKIEAQIKAWHQSSHASRRLEKVPGIGPLTATALVATVGDAKTSTTAGNLPLGSAWCLDSTPAGQANAAGHEQTRRCLLENAADPRRPLCDLPGYAAGRCSELVGQANRPAQQERGRRSAGEQDRQGRLGATRMRPGIQVRLPRCIVGNDSDRE